MGHSPGGEMIDLDCAGPIWDRFYLVAPLVLVGTVEPDGRLDLAAKHMAGPVSWDNHWGFVCAPSHATYRNIERTREFTVSYPTPDQIIQVSLSAAPRLDDDAKPSLDVLATTPAKTIAGAHLAGSSLKLECELERIIDDLGENSLLIGNVVAAQVAPVAARGPDRDGNDILAESPLLAYLPPDRFTAIDRGNSFPFHAGWKR